MNKFIYLFSLCLFLVVFESNKVETAKEQYVLGSITTNKVAALRSLNESINNILYSLINQPHIYSIEQLTFLSIILKKLLESKREVQYDIASSYFSLRGG